MKTWYGSLDNRLMENKDAVEEIKVGDGMTEFYYSDREAYEVIEVRDQKHVTVRTLDHKATGESMSNKWELISNENNPTYDMVKRGKYWYFTSTITEADVERYMSEHESEIDLIIAGWDLDKIREKGKQTKYTRANVAFGYADYYYDYEF